MPDYLPTAEHLARLGYAPDPAHDVPAGGLVGYSCRAPWPYHPFYAQLVVQVRPGGVFLQYYAKQAVIQWQGWAVPTPLFFEQLLQALGWPVGPPLPDVVEASPELMLLRWIAYHPAEAYQLGAQLATHSCLPGLQFDELVQVVERELPAPGARASIRTPRPGLIELTAAGQAYLHQCRNYRETPKNLPDFITKSTK